MKGDGRRLLRYSYSMAAQDQVRTSSINYDISNKANFLYEIQAAMQ